MYLELDPVLHSNLEQPQSCFQKLYYTILYYKLSQSLSQQAAVVIPELIRPKWENWEFEVSLGNVVNTVSKTPRAGPWLSDLVCTRPWGLILSAAKS